MQTRLLVLSLSLWFSGLSYAVDLVTVFHDALNQDPQFKAACSQFSARAEAIPQAKSALLPALSLSAELDRSLQGPSLSQARSLQNFNSGVWELNISQRIFDAAAWQGLQKAKAEVKAARAELNAASQELILRSTRAYLQLLAAEDRLAFSQANRSDLQKELVQYQQRYAVGLEEQSRIYQAKANCQLAEAELIAAKNHLENKKLQLHRITKQHYTELASLAAEALPLLKLSPKNKQDWVQQGIAHNYHLLASQYALAAAKEQIKAQKAYDWPSLALLANAREQRSSAAQDIYNPNHLSTANLGLRLNFPVLQGGFSRSKNRQAEQNYQKQSEHFELAHRDLVVNTQIAYNSVNTQLAKLEADRSQLRFAQNKLANSASQLAVGNQTQVELLAAQKQLRLAKLNSAADQYALINAVLKLKFQAGSLKIDDLVEINHWLSAKGKGPHRTQLGLDPL